VIQKILIFILLLVLALVGYKMLQPKTTTSNNVTADTDTSVAAFTAADLDDIPPTYVDLEASSSSSSVANPAVTSQPVLTAQSAVAPSFACDGRRHCSQMTSCAEATYFIQHCPNTKMDGNNDGIPCEKQWCH
jgi:hypothetical protein